MGYFPNGTTADCYYEKYCAHCVHCPTKQEENPCAVWFAHLVKNYDDCNKEDSILHILIPRDGIENLQCKMFVAADPLRCHLTGDLFG